MRWTLGIGATLLVGFGLYYVYYSQITNARVMEELRSDPDGARAAKVMILKFPSGRELPVNYLRDGNQVFAGADGRWWRAFRDGNVPVSVLIRGALLTGRARVVLDDPAYTRRIFERLRANVPAWLPSWLDANLIVIDLDPADSAAAPGAA